MSAVSPTRVVDRGDEWRAAAESADTDAFLSLLAEDFRGACEFVFRITNRKNKLVGCSFGRVQMVLYWYILHALRTDSPLRLWVLKGRQFGSSTLFMLYLSWCCYVHHRNGLLAAHLESNGKTIFKKAETVLKHLPEGLVPPPLTKEIGTLLSFGAPLEAILKRESAERVEIGVGETYQNLLLTEVPRWKDAETSMSDLLPTIPDVGGTAVIGEFTAKGVGNYGHKMWVDSVAGVTGFDAVFLPYYWHEEYERERGTGEAKFTREELEYREWVEHAGSAYPLDESGGMRDTTGEGFLLSDAHLMWRRDTLRNFRGDVDRFREQFPATADEAFLTSGRLVVPAAVQDRAAKHVNRLGGQTVQPRRGEFEVSRTGGAKAITLRDRSDGELWIWGKPERGCRYVVSGDTASGTGPDFSASHVINTSSTPLQVVASFRGKRPTHEFARLLRRLGTAYNNALIVPERNMGEHVIKVLLNDLAYSNVYRHFSPIKAGATTFASDHGFPVHRGTKLPLVHKLQEAFYEDRILVPCERTIGELRSFVWTNDDQTQAAAQSGAHDDLVMSLAIGLWVALDMPEELSERELADLDMSYGLLGGATGY